MLNSRISSYKAIVEFVLLRSSIGLLTFFTSYVTCLTLGLNARNYSVSMILPMYFLHLGAVSYILTIAPASLFVHLMSILLYIKYYMH